jgi:hypothetical protein
MPAIAQSGIHAGTLTTTLSIVGSAVTAGKQQRIDFIRVTNTTANSRTVDVALNDGANTLYLCKGYSIAANDVVNITASPLWLPAGWSLRALASANTSLDIIASYLEAAI